MNRSIEPQWCSSLIPRLPPEIVDMIVDCISPHSLSVLIKLHTASRIFRVACLRRMCAYVELTPSNCERRVLGLHRLPQLRLYVRTIEFSNFRNSRCHLIQCMFILLMTARIDVHIVLRNVHFGIFRGPICTEYLGKVKSLSSINMIGSEADVNHTLGCLSIASRLTIISVANPVRQPFIVDVDPSGSPLIPTLLHLKELRIANFNRQASYLTTGCSSLVKVKEIASKTRFISTGASLGQPECRANASRGTPQALDVASHVCAPHGNPDHADIVRGHPLAVRHPPLSCSGIKSAYIQNYMLLIQIVSLAITRLRGCKYSITRRVGVRHSRFLVLATTALPGNGWGGPLS